MLKPVVFNCIPTFGIDRVKITTELSSKMLFGCVLVRRGLTIYYVITDRIGWAKTPFCPFIAKKVVQEGKG